MPARLPPRGRPSGPRRRQATPQSASERRGNNVKRCTYIYLQATAVIWPGLSYMCQLGRGTCLFRPQGSGFRVQGSGCRVQGVGFRVQGFRVPLPRPTTRRPWGPRRRPATTRSACNDRQDLDQKQPKPTPTNPNCPFKALIRTGLLRNPMTCGSNLGNRKTGFDSEKTSSTPDHPATMGAATKTGKISIKNAHSQDRT